MKKLKSRFTSLILSALVVFAMTAAFIPAASALLYADSGLLDSYAESQPVEFGYLRADNSIDWINSIDLGSFELSNVNPNDENTYTIKRTVCIKGTKNSGLILSRCDMDGDIDSGYGGFSGGYPQTNWNEGVPYLITEVCFDSRVMKAGTYSAVMQIKVKKESSNGNYVDTDISANGGALVSTEGVLSVPMTIKLTGMNPAVASKVSGLKASAGNDLVTLTWNSSEKQGPFTVYRRDGIETASPDSIDLSKYEAVSNDPVYTNKYYDNTARNGKTYSYFVILGDDLDHTYPSTTATATPSKKAIKEPVPPILQSPNSDLGTVTLEWHLDQDSKSELDMIDHFNVYKNGIVVAQVDQNAYKESVEDIWDDEQDKSVTYHSYKWTLTLDTEPAVAKWWVTAVSKDGVEGSSSEKFDEGSMSEATSIRGWSAWYTDYYRKDDETDYKPAICIKIDDASYYNVEFVKLWKKTGEGGYNYLGKFKFNSVIGSGEYDYADTAISKDSIYTYKATVIDTKKNESEPVEFTVKASEDGVSYAVDYYYSLDENNNPVFDFFGDSGYTYKLCRKNGNTVTEVSSKAGNNTYATFTDDVKNLDNGTYTYYLESTKGGVTTKTRNITYVKDTSERTMAQKPGTPTVTARISGESKDKIVLKWNKSSEGGEPDGYYIYKKISEKVDGQKVRVFDTSRFDESDDYTSTWWMSEYPQDRYIRLRADKNTFTDTIEWGYEDQFTVKYWVRAYNQYGESEIDYSLIASYGYNEGNPRTNGDTAAPGEPIIKNAWIEPDDKYDDKQDVIVTWEAPIGQGGVDYYKVTFEKKDGNSWDVMHSETFDTGKERRCCYTADTDYDTGTYRVIVKAINKKGSSEAVSGEVKVAVLPKLSLSTTSLDKVNVEWTDSNGLNANQFALYRKEEFGLWEKVTSGNGITKSGNTYSYTDNSPSLVEGTRYMYRVEAKDTDTSSRLSLIKSILLASSSILPGKPTNLTVAKIDSYAQYLLTWSAPATGGTPLRYQIQHWTDEDQEWRDAETVPATTTSYAELYFSDKLRVVAENDAGRGEPSNEVALAGLPDREDTGWPHSIIPTVHASTETDDEPFVTLSWEKDTHSGWGEASYYAIYRYDGTSYREELVADVPARDGVTNYSWTDRDVESGMYYEYYLRPTNSFRYDYVSDYSVWAEPESKKETSAARAVRKIAALIDGLPAETDLDVSNSMQVSRVTQVNELYKGLSKEQKGQIDKVSPAIERTAKLSALVNKIKNAKAEIEYSDGEGNYITKPVQDQINAACSAVISEFTSVDGITTAILEDDHKTMYRGIRSARSAYEALSDDAKRTVNTGQLSQIEAKINELKQNKADYDAAQNVLNKLNALPTVEYYHSKSGDEAKAVEYQTDAARRTYDALLSRQKTLLAGMNGYAASYKRLTDLEAEIAKIADRDAAANVDSIIEAIPSPVTLAAKSAVENARAAYNALSSDAQKKVTKLNELVAAEREIARLKREAENIRSASEVAALIDDLPAEANVSLDDEGDVLYAQTALSNLSDEQKALVDTIDPASSRREKLSTLISKIGALRKQADQAAAGIVAGMIEALPGSVNVGNVDVAQPLIADARREYEKLTQAQKAYVSQASLTKLTRLEDEVGNIKDPIAAGEVQELIDALPDENGLKLSDEGRLNNASAKYYALTDKQKALVDSESVKKLGKLETRMTVLKAEKAEADRRAAEEARRRAAEEAARAAAAAQPPEVMDLKAIKISKPSAAKKKLTAKWKKPKKKDLKKIQGIEIRVIGPGVDRTVTAGAKKTSKKIGGLQSKQKYTVMVRAYRYDGNVKHVSAWKSKKVKVK